MKTRVTELLGIEYPIIQGGMAWVAEHNLAAAVSEAGGFGLIGGANAPGEVVREEIRKAKESKQKRLLSAFQLTVSLAAVIVVMFLLRDNPTVMVNILYIIAIIAGLWIWKNPRS